MRRDYFLCVFLLCLCVSLFFVLFTPLYFLYGEIVPRDFGGIETMMSWLFALMVFVAIPVYAAWRKKLWMAVGLASYSFVVGCLPAWILPGMADKLVGEDANIVSVVFGGFLKDTYSTVEAPFGPMSRALGDDFTESLPRKILPVVLIVYAVVQIFRFYKAAYEAEQVTPVSALDSTVKENNIQGVAGVRESQTLPPEILGTVISAPVASAPGPMAAPVARPVATPVAAPVARPVSVSVAVPASPSETPAARPVAMPVAQPVAQPATRPVALPGNMGNNVATRPNQGNIPPQNN